MHLPSCCRCLTNSQSGLCTICIRRSLSAASGTHGWDDEEFVSKLAPLFPPPFLLSCFRFGSVPTRSSSEFRWHLSSRDVPRVYLLAESPDNVSAFRFLLTESKLPWRHRTRSRSLCWYLQSIICKNKFSSLVEINLFSAFVYYWNKFRSTDFCWKCIERNIRGIICK